MPEPPTLAFNACPKCGKKRSPEMAACARCGLVFALWKPETAAAFAPLDAEGDARWQKLQTNWSDASLHEDFVRHCLQSNTLAAAGRLYRARLDETPNDAIAAHMQGQVLAKAALGLSLSKSVPPQPVTRNRWFWVVVLTAMALGIGAGLFWHHAR